MATSDLLILFSLFFTPDIIRSIVEETNHYAARCLEGKPKTCKTSDEEIKAYFGFYILVGLVKEPDYWATEETFHYTPIVSCISRNRFEDISRYLHFVDKRNLPPLGSLGYHRLPYVKPLLDALRERCSVVYHPGPNLSVDEEMIPFKGECTHPYPTAEPYGSKCTARMLPYIMRITMSCSLLQCTV